VLAEVVEHDLEHVHRRSGGGGRRAPACVRLGDQADRVDDDGCSHGEAACDDLLSYDVANRTERGLQLAVADDGGLDRIHPHDRGRKVGSQSARQGGLPRPRQTREHDEHTVTLWARHGAERGRPQVDQAPAHRRGSDL